LLVELLQDSREQVRDLALKACKRLGKRATTILASLRKAEGKVAADRRGQLRQAIAAVQQEPASGTVEAYWSTNRRLRRDITAFCRSLRQCS
jgi:hypothetical protein